MTGRCQCGAAGVIGIVSDQIGRRNYCRDHLGDALELVPRRFVAETARSAEPTELYAFDVEMRGGQPWAWSITIQGMGALRDSVSTEHGALRAARASRRRRTSPELLEQVAELHRKGGVELVKSELGYQERNARRLLKLAREAGLDTEGEELVADLVDDERDGAR